ncbi:hypothetical protein WN48_10942 [Eufriesea mexicana]|uniref:Uncharacterized protein n=1 Tax=Eufriesea mexicana TaxID=516756 RepID=A0A310SCL4_9HYME|nr:hypothetical protein WN48_10942 [Eufriesea mexicana]
MQGRMYTRVQMPELTAGHEWEFPRRAKGKRRQSRGGGGTQKGASVARREDTTPFSG